MKHARQNSYVEREMRRRRVAEYWNFVNKAEECIAGMALVILTVAFFFALCVI